MSGCAGGACLVHAPWRWEPEAQHWGRAPRRPSCPPTSSSALSSCRPQKLVRELGTIPVPLLSVRLPAHGGLSVLFQAIWKSRVC